MNPLPVSESTVMFLDYISGATEVVHDDLNTINDNQIYNSILYIADTY